MGLLGDLVFGDKDENLRAQLNAGNKLLLDFNELHNAIVIHYRTYSESAAKFNATLLALKVTQYASTYARESLDAPEQATMPKTRNAAADQVQKLALTFVGLDLTIKTLNSIGGKVSNLSDVAGAYRGNIAEGLHRVKTALSYLFDKVQGSYEEMRMSTSLSLNTTGNEALAIGQEAGQSANAAGALGMADRSSLSTANEVGDAANTVLDGGESTEAASGASLTGLLGPLALLALLVTEVISLIEEKKDIDKLKTNSGKLAEILREMKPRLKSLITTYRLLLTSSMNDMNDYQQMITHLNSLEHPHSVGIPNDFEHTGIDNLIEQLTVAEQSVDEIDFSFDFEDASSAELHTNSLRAASAIINAIKSSLDSLYTSSEKNINTLRDVAAQHALHDDQMANVISLMRSHVYNAGKKNGKIDADFKRKIVDTLGIKAEKIEIYDKFRIYLNAHMIALLPYYKEIQKKISDGKTSKDLPDLEHYIDKSKKSYEEYSAFNPDPNDFRIPLPPSPKRNSSQPVAMMTVDAVSTAGGAAGAAASVVGVFATTAKQKQVVVSDSDDADQPRVTAAAAHK